MCIINIKQIYEKVKEFAKNYQTKLIDDNIERIEVRNNNKIIFIVFFEHDEYWHPIVNIMYDKYNSDTKKIEQDYIGFTSGAIDTDMTNSFIKDIIKKLDIAISTNEVN